MTRSVLRFTATAVAAFLVTACSAGENSDAQAEAATSAQAAGGTVTLQARPNLSGDMEAMPRLVGDSPAIQAINAALDQSDTAARQNAADCAADAGNGPGGGWARWITQPMTGPAYVTLREHLEYFCGGAYPSNQQTAVTYDLATGRPVDWTAALPGLGLTVSTFEEMPPGYVPLVSSAALGAFYSRKMLANPDAEWVEQCRDVFEPERLAEQTFNIWADAENGGVSVSPDFPRVVQACADTATLTAADLRGFDAEPALVAAIVAARAAGHWAPKDTAPAGESTE